MAALVRTAAARRGRTHEGVGYGITVGSGRGRLLERRRCLAALQHRPPQPENDEFLLNNCRNFEESPLVISPLRRCAGGGACYK